MKKLSRTKSSRRGKGRARTGNEDVLVTLRQKLHPSHLRLSGKMRALVDFVLGERFTTPWIAGVAVTSDGFAIAQPANENGLLHDEFFGHVVDLYKNFAGVLRTVGVTPEEARLFSERYRVLADDPRAALFDAHISDLLRETDSPVANSDDPTVMKLKKQISVLRNVHGRTSAEAATAQRIADELEEKIKK